MERLTPVALTCQGSFHVGMTAKEEYPTPPHPTRDKREAVCFEQVIFRLYLGIGSRVDL